jgi:broad specificity phosphatase PhoE
VTLVYLVRHGATEWNVTRRAQGTADIDLNDLGRTQAEETAQHLARQSIDAVYSSQLRRAVDTATRIADRHGLQVVKDERFQEIDQGDWTGLTTAEIADRWPDLWGPARHYSRRPGGESPAEVRVRALAGLAEVVRAWTEGTCVIVSHGGTIRTLTAEALGYDDLRSRRIRGLGNGGIVSLTARLSGDRLILGNLRRFDGATPDLDDPND